MHICYISSYLDAQLFEKTQESSVALNHAIQKFNTLLLKGFSSEDGVWVHAVSTLEHGIRPSKKSISEQVSGKEIDIKYAWNWNVKGLRNFGIMVSTFLNVLKMPKDTVVLSDVLKVSGTIGGLLAAKLRGFHTVGIVTDLPEFQDISSRRIMLRLNNWAIRKQDGYVFLTEAMNTRLNHQQKPYVIVEGFADEGMRTLSHATWTSDRKIVIYAGSLCRKYGICDLIDAFLKVKKENEELWIYGDGDYASEVSQIASKHGQIRYFGRQPNSVVVASELEAVLLVNPRTPEGEYTKYSFPSKTLEYMSTGTPVLMYQLPGIPDEYKDYLYYIRDRDTFSDDLRCVLDESVGKLAQRGEDAKRFVLNEKNSTIQASKIISMIRRM